MIGEKTKRYVQRVCILVAKAIKGVFETNKVFEVVQIVESKAAGLRVKRLGDAAR